MPTTAERTALFRQLHADGLLLLANAWDAGSARLIESLGARASATTSAGLAWSQGYPDGDHLPVARLLDSVDSIVRVLSTPLTVDIEGGYSDDPDTVAGTVLHLVRRGVSGINLEDGGDDPAVLCAKIARIREHCREAGSDVFVNVRTDVYLRRLAPAGAASVQETLARAALYREAVWCAPPQRRFGSRRIGRWPPATPCAVVPRRGRRHAGGSAGAGLRAAQRAVRVRLIRLVRRRAPLHSSCGASVVAQGFDQEIHDRAHAGQLPAPVRHHQRGGHPAGMPSR